MQDLIRDDLKTLLADWHAGRPVRTLILGHSMRLMPAKGNEPAYEEPIIFRQKRALAYAFALIDAALEDDVGLLLTRKFEHYCAGAPADLSREEKEAAESLAWKALLRGWSLAIAGHDNHRYITITNPEPAQPVARSRKVS